MSKNIPAIKSIFQNLWADYVNLNPNINKIHSLIEKQGESIINDHIAFRTFGLDGIRVEDLAKFFLDLGYT